MQQYCTKLSTSTNRQAKASRNAEHNPMAIFRKVVSKEGVLNCSVQWPGVMTGLMACPPTDGVAASIGLQDVNVVELHDRFAQNDLITYETLALYPEGVGGKFIVDGDNTYGGQVVTNPSDGLLFKGHPLGATGLARCAELVQQPRGTAEQRQVENARLAPRHNLDLGCARFIPHCECA